MHAKLEEYLPEVETSLPVLENIESDVVGQARQGNPGHIGTVDLTDRVDVVLGTDTLYIQIQRHTTTSSESNGDILDDLGLMKGQLENDIQQVDT